MWALVRSARSRLAPLSVEVDPPMEVLPHSLGTREQGETGGATQTRGRYFNVYLYRAARRQGRKGLARREGRSGRWAPVPCENY